MATCPQCGINSRHESRPITISSVWRAQPLGPDSPAGGVRKASMRRVLEMSCMCGYAIQGHLDGDGQSFLGDPATQRFSA